MYRYFFGKYICDVRPRERNPLFDVLLFITCCTDTRARTLTHSLTHFISFSLAFFSSPTNSTAAMSMLRRKPAAVAAAPSPQVVSSDLYFNIQPQTHPAVAPTADKLRAQTQVIANMQTQCADLFTANPGVRSFQNGSEIFHTSQLYGTSVSVEELAHNMNEYGLCLAVSATMPSKNSNILGMLDASKLTAENCSAGHVRISTGTKGAMVVSFRENNGLHYIHSVDFHVN